MACRPVDRIAEPVDLDLTPPACAGEAIAQMDVARALGVGRPQAGRRQMAGGSTWRGDEECRAGPDGQRIGYAVVDEDSLHDSAELRAAQPAVADAHLGRHGSGEGLVGAG